MSKLYTKTQYSKIKGVSKQYISNIREKLKTKKIGSVEFIVDCKSNDKMFLNPAPNRKK